MTVGVYVKFNGNCRQALNYYANLFKTEPSIMTFSEMPPDPEFPIPENMKDLVMHGNFSAFGSLIMVSDGMPGQEHTVGDNISLIVTWDDPKELKRVFEILSKDGIVLMPLEKTFWSELFGSVRDRFGIEWQFDYDG
jgi:PhnB protein